MKKKGLYWLAVALIVASCTDDAIVIAPPAPLPEGSVSVELPLEMEDAADASELYGRESDTRAAGSGIDVRLEPSAQTRAGGALATAKADALYQLYMMQLDKNGTTVLTAPTIVAERVELGKTVTLNLKESEECQLLFYARGGATGDASSAGGDMTAANWKDYKAPDTWINAIEEGGSATVEELIKKMPYYLVLKKVKVKKGATEGTGVVESIAGEDVRLRMRRLAVRLTAEWTYNVTDYELQSVVLYSIPTKYAAFPVPNEKDGTYPTLVDQFTTRTLETTISSGSFSCWVPRNVRGEVGISLPTQRSKKVAPLGSSYLQFIATNKANPKKRLFYRVYLGGNSTSDFNLLDNTNYHFKIDFNHADESIITGDARVEYQNGIPAEEQSSQLVPTANCFMIEPGGTFHFDPFQYQQNGNTIDNALLKSWCTGSTGIKSVRLLWQTREQGDVGDPVMGIANSKDDHTNIVSLKFRNPGITTAQAAGDCYIYCHAANTLGGNAAIAAYDGENGTGNILWSWHVWVTNYSPEATGNVQILDDANKRKLRFSSNGVTTLPIMDRNLGALAGYVNEVPTSYLEKSKTNGLHYQWGRKDPFPSSYSEKDIKKITNKDATTPPEGMQNRYGADGVTYVQNVGVNGTPTIRVAFQNPTYFYAQNTKGPKWTSDQASANAQWNNVKSLSDPCPAGWRVASSAEFAAVNKGSTNQLPGASVVSNPSTAKADGGYLVYFEDTGKGLTSYFRFTGYGRYFNTFENINSLCALWFCNQASTDKAYGIWMGEYLDDDGSISKHSTIKNDKWKSDASVVRCIQEKE